MKIKHVTNYVRIVKFFKLIIKSIKLIYLHCYTVNIEFLLVMQTLMESLVKGIESRYVLYL